jgi:hypothetical protein
VLLAKYYSGKDIKNEMGDVTYGGEERNIQGFGEDTLGKETAWKT